MLVPNVCSKIEATPMNLKRLRRVSQAQSFPVETPPEALAATCKRLAFHEAQVVQMERRAIVGTSSDRQVAEWTRSQHQAYKKRMGC